MQDCTSRVMSLLTVLCLTTQLVVARTRQYDFTVTWENGAPDGHTRQMFKINGQFPGPTIELEEGDDININVKNQSPFNTTIHYHGIEQQGTPWSDGTPGISQDQIHPGCSFTYQWKATTHGSYFYHAHSQAQMMDGLLGAITIHPGRTAQTPYSLVSKDPKAIAAMTKAERRRIPLLLNDWTHYTSVEAWDNSLKTYGQNTCGDTMLINGKGSITCLTPDQQNKLMSQETAYLLTVVPGSNLTDKSCLPPAIIAAFTPPDTPTPDYSKVPKDFFYGCTASTGGSTVWPITQKHHSDDTWVMFDLIGAYSNQLGIVSFDELPMHVIAVDGQYIEPQTVTSLDVANGERYTVLINPKQPKKYSFRLSQSAPIQISWATGTLDFKIRGKPQSKSPSIPYINEAGTNLTTVTSFDLDHAPPFPASPPPQKADATYILTMTDLGIYAAMNYTPLYQDFEDKTPLLFHPQPRRQDNTTLTISSSAKVVDYILLSAEGGPTHPIHMHGRHFYVLGRGTGNWTWSSVDEAAKSLPAGTFNFENPAIRDTMPTGSEDNNWMVLRRDTGNPGVWLMHCHILNHLQGGQAVVIQEGLDRLGAVPGEYGDHQC